MFLVSAQALGDGALAGRALQVTPSPACLCLTSPLLQHTLARLLLALFLCRAACVSMTLRTVVISCDEARFRHTSAILARYGLGSTRRYQPPAYNSSEIRARFAGLFPGRKPTALELKMLSLSTANADVASLIAGSHRPGEKSWYLVFEDDITVPHSWNVSSADMRQSIDKLLELAAEDGIAALGRCAPRCTEQIEENGVLFGRCTGYCTHAMAYAAEGALFWRDAFLRAEGSTGSERSRFRHRAYSPDNVLQRATRKHGGVWTAGVNLRSGEGDAGVGLFVQHRSKFPTSIGV